MDTSVKITLKDTYCKSRMNFALENTFLCQKDYADLNTIECKILKSAVGLRKYHSNTLMNNALGITPIETMLKIRKLNFINELMGYELTSDIIEQQMSNNQRIPPKSFIREILKLTDKANLKIEEVQKTTLRVIREMKEKVKKDQNSKTSLALKYLLEKELARNLFVWSNNPKYTRSTPEAG